MMRKLTHLIVACLACVLAVGTAAPVAAETSDVLHITAPCAVGWDDDSSAPGSGAADESCDVQNVRTADGGYLLTLHGQIPGALMNAFRAAGSPSSYHTGCLANYGFLYEAHDFDPSLFVFTSSVRHFTPDGQMTEVCSTASDAATPTRVTGGAGSGGALDNEVLALFEFGFNGDELDLVRLAWWSGVQEEGQQDEDNPDCIYSGTSTEDEGLSWIDSGGSVVIRLDGVTASCGTVNAELEVIYRNSPFEMSAIVDDACDGGGMRRGVRRLGSPGAATAVVYIETDPGDPIIDATGGADYSIDRWICIDPVP